MYAVCSVMFMYSYVKNTGQKTGNVSAPCPRLGTGSGQTVGTRHQIARPEPRPRARQFLCAAACAVVGGGPPLSDIRTHVISSRQQSAARPRHTMCHTPQPVPHPPEPLSSQELYGDMSSLLGPWPAPSSGPGDPPAGESCSVGAGGVQVFRPLALKTLRKVGARPAPVAVLETGTGRVLQFSHRYIYTILGMGEFFVLYCRLQLPAP